MQYDPNKHHRRSIRLKGYDYASVGAYFITICTHDRDCLFGAIEHGEMRLNEYGQIVADAYLWLATQYAYVQLDAWVVMPNHFHGILVVTDEVDRGGNGLDGADGSWGGDRLGTAGVSRGRGVSRNAPTDPPIANEPIDNGTRRKPLGRLIGAFKTVSAKQINLVRNTPGAPVWQRNYYEHIIRNERAFQNIQKYIRNNPIAWQQDQLHPDNCAMKH